MKIEEYIDKNKLAFVACASVGIAALLFVQKMTTPVKSKNNNVDNANNNSHNRVAHTRTRRVRRDVHSLPAQQGITTLSHINSSTNDNTNHSHLHRRHNNNSNSMNNTAMTNNISDLQRSQTVNHSSNALSLMTRSSTRNRSQSRQVHERSISPLTDTQLTNNNINNNNNSSTVVTHKKKVDLTEHDDKTSNSLLTKVKQEHSDDVANNKVMRLESTSPESNIEVESSKMNIAPAMSKNATSKPLPMQNTDIYNNNNLTNRHNNKSKEKDEIVGSVNKSAEGNVNAADSDNSNVNQDSVVVTKPLTVESLHHLRQQGEVISPSSSTLTKKSHEHIAAQLTIPVNALQLSKLALPLNKDRNTNNDTANKHGKGKTTNNRNHYHESELYKQDKEIEDIKNDKNMNEPLAEDELKDNIPQTARAHILPLIEQQQEQPHQEQQQYCRNKNVFTEVQKPKLLISKSVQVSLPLRAKQHDYDKNKLSSEKLIVEGMHSEVNHYDRGYDNDDNVRENKKNRNNNYCSTKEEQTSHEAKKLFESNGKQSNHVNENERDNVIVEEDAIDVSPIPHQPSNEHSPIVSHWAELSPSVEQEQLTVPEHLLRKLENQIILLVEQIQQSYSRNVNTKDIYTSSYEWCWMQLYNYLMSIPTSVLSSLTCKLAKQERITAFINEVNKRANSCDNKELPQALLTLEEVKKEIVLMLSSNITLEQDTHYELDKVDNNTFIIHKVKSKFKPMLTDVELNESLSRMDDSDLEKSHRKRRFVSVTIASDSDNDDDDDEHDSNKEYDKINANNQIYTSTIYNLLGKYSYLENTHDTNKNHRSNDKECNDSERQQNVNGNCNTMNICSSTQPHKQEQFFEVKRENGSTIEQTAPENSNRPVFERNTNSQQEDENIALSENVVHLLNNIAAMAKCKEFTLLCSSAQGSHLAKEIAELATSAQHVLESCDKQASSHSEESLSQPPSQKQLQEEWFEKKKEDQKTEEGFVSSSMKSLLAPPSLPTLANAHQRTEACSEKQIVDEQTPQQQKLHRSNAVARYNHNDDKNKEDAHLSALRQNEMSVDTTFDNISPAQSCPQKVYDNETKANNYPHRPTVRSRRSRSNSPPTNNFSNGITETSPNSKLFSLSRSPFTIDIVNDHNKINSSMVNNTLDVFADDTDHYHYERKMEQTNNMHSQLTKQSVFERLYSPSSNTKTKKV